MSSKLFKCVILGPPASGKGTISSRIVKAFNLLHISSGDKLRLNIQNKTSIGLQAQTYLEAGQLVPDDIMMRFIVQELNKSRNNSWLLDGFPRTLPQAEALWKIQKLDLVLNLVVPFHIIVDRVKGRLVHLESGRVYNEGFNSPIVPGKDDFTGDELVQRNDDKPDILRRRLEKYQEITTPVIDFFKQKNVLYEFKGNTSDEIWLQVFNSLSTYIPLHMTIDKPE